MNKLETGEAVIVVEEEVIEKGEEQQEQEKEIRSLLWMSRFIHAYTVTGDGYACGLVEAGPFKDAGWMRFFRVPEGASSNDFVDFMILHRNDDVIDFRPGGSHRVAFEEFLNKKGSSND